MNKDDDHKLLELKHPQNKTVMFLFDEQQKENVVHRQLDDNDDTSDENKAQNPKPNGPTIKTKPPSKDPNGASKEPQKPKQKSFSRDPRREHSPKPPSYRKSETAGLVLIAIICFICFSC